MNQPIEFYSLYNELYYEYENIFAIFDIIILVLKILSLYILIKTFLLGRDVRSFDYIILTLLIFVNFFRLIYLTYVINFQKELLLSYYLQLIEFYNETE